MKRHGNLFNEIISIDNLKIATKKAIKGKRKQYGVIKFLNNEEKNILNLHNNLKNKTFTTSKYKTFKIFENKEREISKLPFYPDRLLHTAIINILEPIFVGMFVVDTYSCIKGRGVHKASYKLRKDLKQGFKYCLKLDIKKFYPSVDNEILRALIRRKFKDKDLLWLLDDIILSTKGLPLGSYTSQFLSNYYLTYFDYFVKQELKIKSYYRYSDDMVILSNSKEELWEWFYKIRNYLSRELNLEVKGNHQIFPIESRGIDFLGYVHYHTHTLIRKRIKKKYIKSKNKRGYYSWLKHCNSKNLIRKYEEQNQH